MKDLKGIKGKYYIARLIEEGEHEHQDFKFAISDARKIARSISAFANRDGGRLLVGVKDNGVVAGVRNEEDIFVIEQAAEMYCRPPQEIRVTAFKAEEEKTVLRIEIDRAQRRPVLVMEADGSAHAYYRVKDENISATPLMVRAWEAASSETEGVLISLSESESRLAGMIADGPVTVEEFMLAAKVSRSTAEDIVVRLHTMNLLDFVYNGKTFLLCRMAEPEEES
ncbi:helix-turn-helix domain-containing protein [Duncaniella sp.]|uniref:AlbA family DNA-binding domain-containing protein n=1 Tax=Duncaniella sp. TaxID=2518496 RepID=UPI0023CA6382|nr:ATP-binding protein [Duncaniella sp.]MDE5904755.1 ATP-binding protein [Duncaniella sp.]